MNAQTLYSPLRWLSFLVLLLMAVAVGYAGYISLANWPAIGV
jgi:hypothetical protein